MLARLIIIAAAVIGSGLALGRKTINRKIEEKLPAEIEIARAAAMTELDKQTSKVVRERLIAFGLNLCTKAGTIGAVYLLFHYDHLTATGLKFAVITLIALFLLRDASKTLPYMLPALKLVRTHKWNFQRALTEFVAGVAFERTYAEAIIAMETGPHRTWLALSKYSAHNLSTEVAKAVAELARQTSFERIMPRVLLGGGIALVMLIVYCAFFIFTVGAA